MMAESMVIDGRMHVQMKNGLYRRVPLGMDEARDAKGKAFPDYAVQNGKPFEVANGKKYAEYLVENGADTIFAERSGETGKEQTFLQVDRDMALMVRQENGSLVPQTIEKGGYINVTNLDAVSGMSNQDFTDGYHVTRVVPGSQKEQVDKTEEAIPEGREIPFPDEPAADDGLGLGE